MRLYLKLRIKKKTFKQVLAELETKRKAAQSLMAQLTANEPKKDKPKKKKDDFKNAIWQ